MALVDTAGGLVYAAATPPRTAAVCLGVVLLAAAYLRFHGISDDSLWRDEAVTWLQARGSWLDVITATARDNYPPLYNLFDAASLRLFGNSEFALRAPSAVFGVMNVAALYWVGTIVAGRMAGLLAALLLAFAPFHIWYSQEARAYTLMTLLATVFAGAALSLARKATLARVVAVLLSAIGLLYTHPYGAFLWLSISVAILALTLLRPVPDGASPLIWLLAQVAAGIAFAPWALVLIGRAHAIEQDGFWLEYPTPGFVLEQVDATVSGPLVLALLTIALIGAFLPVRRSRDDLPEKVGASAEQWLLVAWMLGPAFIGIGISLVSTPLFHARYIIGSLPALFLLAAVGVLRFVDGWRGIAAMLVTAIAVSLLAFGHGGPGSREDWRSTAAYVSANLPADGCVLVRNRSHAAALTFYLRRSLPCLGASTQDPSRINSNFLMVVTLGEPSRAILAKLPSSEWRRGQVVDFRGIEVIAFQRN